MNVFTHNFQTELSASKHGQKDLRFEQKRQANPWAEECAPASALHLPFVALLALPNSQAMFLQEDTTYFSKRKPIEKGKSVLI